MHQLSEAAQAKRKRDMMEVIEQANFYQLTEILLIGVLLLAKSMADKLQPGQRAALVLLLFVAGGSAIGLLIYNGFWGLALVIVFVMGILFAEIRRL